MTASRPLRWLVVLSATTWLACAPSENASTREDAPVREPNARETTTREPNAREPNAREPNARESTTRETRARELTAQGASARETSSPEPSRRDACVVASVSDGDSFRCRDDRRIRLLLLDAPEMDQGTFGQRARDALRARLRRGDTAWLEFDVQREDRYGRTLANVYTAARGGTFVNLAQAADGWAVAVVFPPNVRDIARIRAAVAEARRERRGLWADGGFTCEPIAHKRGEC